MRYKHWTIAFVLLTFCGSISIGVGNYLLDPFGLGSVEKKDFYNLSKAEFSYMYPAKIAQKVPYYLVGTSRTWYLSLPSLSHYLKNHTIRVGMASQSLDEMLLLTTHIKANGGHFIAGFDAFSINATRKAPNRLQQEFAKDTHTNTIGFLLNPRTTQASLRYVKDLLLSRPMEWLFDKVDSQSGAHNSHEEILHYRFVQKREDMLYESYTPNTQKILQLARLADSSDIFVIFPKYAYYYELFARYGVQEPYFRAIEILVRNTKARVFSFYGINSITRDRDNFDDYAWHFKPKIGKLILARIFGDPNVSVPHDFGIELTRDNITPYLQSLRGSTHIDEIRRK